MLAVQHSKKKGEKNENTSTSDLEKNKNYAKDRSTFKSRPLLLLQRFYLFQYRGIQKGFLHSN